MPIAFRRRTDVVVPLNRSPDPGLPTLETARLRLRWMRADDLPALERLIGDHGDSRAWNRGGGSDHGEASIYLESVQRGYDLGHSYQWGIARGDDDQLIGSATLYGIDHLQGNAELGFALGREHCGHRYAREALAALLGYAFADLQLRRIEADVDPRSQAALHTLEKLGFRREGYLRQRWRIGGELQDSMLLGLLAAEWPPAT